MFKQEMTANLISYYRKATTEEIIAGKHWYNDAYELAVELAQNSSFTVSQTAAIIAILSPRMSWDRNVELARYFVKTGSTVTANGKQIHTKQQISKLLAVASLNVFPVAQESAIERIICKHYGKTGKNGQLLKSGLPSKTLNFYFNIRAGNSEHVTVDAHAAGAALDSFAGYDERGILAVRHYEEIASAYVSAAAITGMLPSQLQAVVWLVYRRLLGDSRE